MTVLCAENGQEALDIALREPLDAILMDMQMPIMDGYTAAGRLRAAGITTPIVAMTAHAMIEDEKKCLEAGCSHFMSKPVDVDKLLKLLADLLIGIPFAADQPDSIPTEFSVAPSASRSSWSQSALEASSCDTIHCSLPLEDPEFLDIAFQFVHRVQDQLREMAILLASRDYAELAKLAHWLKGSGGTAGFQCLTEVARELEIAAKDQRRDTAELAVGTLIDMVQRIKLPKLPASAGSPSPEACPLPSDHGGPGREQASAAMSLGN